MIDYLQGRVLHKEHAHLSLGVGQAEYGIVGYSIHCSERNLNAIELGEKATFYIYSHVREDLFELFGFLHPDEKKLFLLLISVNGIGPKGGLTMLSHLEPSSLIQCILNKDKDLLTSCPGVGKKTAERIVLELYDPLFKRIEKGEFQSFVKRTKMDSEDSSFSNNRAIQSTLFDETAALFSEARLALVELGIKESTAEQLLLKVKATLDVTKVKELTQSGSLKVEHILKAALKQKQI